jgi:hypothetical protein
VTGGPCPIGDLRGGKDEWPSGVESSPLAIRGGGVQCRGWRSKCSVDTDFYIPGPCPLIIQRVGAMRAAGGAPRKGANSKQVSFHAIRNSLPITAGKPAP